jgi:hypothetical protein
MYISFFKHGPKMGEGWGWCSERRCVPLFGVRLALHFITAFGPDNKQTAVSELNHEYHKTFSH